MSPRSKPILSQASCWEIPLSSAGYPASLKQAIDLPRKQWQRKPVGFVSYGGVAGGLRAVEQLRQVFAELHAEPRGGHG
jgi:NAD(P)H-dependent FMN reductase